MNSIEVFFKDLWRAMLNHPVWTVLILVFVLNVASPVIVVPFLIAKAIDEVQNGDDD